MKKYYYFVLFTRAFSFFQCGIVSKSGGFGQSRRGNGKVAESLEFGGSGEPFPPEGERVSPKIKMKTFPSLYVTLCIREWFKRGENSDAIQESKALIQTGKLGLRNYIPLRQMNVFLASLFNAALGGFTGWCRSLLQPPPPPPPLHCTSSASFSN